MRQRGVGRSVALSRQACALRHARAREAYRGASRISAHASSKRGSQRSSSRSVASFPSQMPRPLPAVRACERARRRRASGWKRLRAAATDHSARCTPLHSLGPRLSRDRDGGHASCHVSAAGRRVGRRPGGGLGDPVQPGAGLLADEAGGWGGPNRATDSKPWSMLRIGLEHAARIHRHPPVPKPQGCAVCNVCRRRLGPTTTPCQSRVP